MSADDLFLLDDIGQLKAMIRTMTAQAARAEKLAASGVRLIWSGVCNSAGCHAPGRQVQRKFGINSGEWIPPADDLTSI